MIPPPLPSRRGPAWWAWALIAFALLPFDPILEKVLPAAPREGKPAVSAATSPEDLALLKLQSQAAIAAAKVDPTSTEKMLEDLTKSVSGDRAAVALALLESFLHPGNSGAEAHLARLSDRVDEKLAALARKALREGLEEGERAELREKMGWFAGLARAPGLEDPPETASLRTRAMLVLGILGMGMMLVCAGGIAGVCLLIFHLRRLKDGRTQNRFAPSPVPGGVLLECFALYLGIMSAGALAGAFAAAYLGPVTYVVAVVVPLLWPRVRGVKWRDFRLATGLHRGAGWGKEILCGAVGYLVVMAVASIGIGITLALVFLVGWWEGLGSEAASASGGLPAGGGGSAGGAAGPQTHPIVGWIYEGNFWQRVLCLVLAAGFAPLFEELYFRGALQRYFRGRFRFFASALLTGLIFAALHPQGFYAIPALGAIGLAFSMLREWRDSLLAPMTAHAINNGTLVLVLWWML